MESPAIVEPTEVTAISIALRIHLIGWAFRVAKAF